MAQGVERCDSSAHQRRGILRGEALGHPCQRLDWRDHIFLVTAVVADPRDSLLLAIDEIAPSAGRASVVLPAMPSNSHALARLPGSDPRPNLVNHSDHFVAWHARIYQPRPCVFLHKLVAVADATCQHSHANLSCPGNRHFPLNDFECPTGLADLCRLHRFHVISPRFNSNPLGFGSHRPVQHPLCASLGILRTLPPRS